MKVDIGDRIVDAEKLKENWALALMSQGVIVRLRISQWRPFARLTPERLGLRFVDNKSYEFAKNYICLGSQKLLPPEVMKKLSSFDRLGRNVLETYSFDTVWGRFVPFTAFDEWERNNEDARRKFLDAAKEVTQKHDDIVRTVRGAYSNIARDVWSRLYPDKGEPAHSFVTQFVEDVVSQIPSAIDMASKFKYETTFFVIPMPSFVENEIAEAQRIKQEAELKQLENDLEKKTKKRIAEEYVKRKKELIDGFLEATVVNMRQYVSELCDSVLLSIGQGSRSKVLRKTHINKLKAMIKKVRYLNFYNDKEITTLLNDLETELDRFKGERNDDVITSKLQEIVDAGNGEVGPKQFSPAIAYLEV